MSTKSKSNSGETTAKIAPAAPRVSKLIRPVARPDSNPPSPLKNTRVSVERSPRSVTSKNPTNHSSHSVTSKLSQSPHSITSKPTVERRSPRVATPPEQKQHPRLKGSDLQAQLTSVQEDLRKSKEQIESIEQEKEHAIDELRNVQESLHEMNSRLEEALLAQKRTEEKAGVEIEQVGIEETLKKEEQWIVELEAARNQHVLDMEKIVSVSHELERVNKELEIVTDAKNQAQIDADNEAKIAQMNMEKAKCLSLELTRLKELLDSKLEQESKDGKEMELKLNDEIQKSKRFEEKLQERERCMNELNLELQAAKMAALDSNNLLKEWEKKVTELTKSEEHASETLRSVMKRLEERSDSLNLAGNEIDALKEKMRSLEEVVCKQKLNLEESEKALRLEKEEGDKMVKNFEFLSSELQKRENSELEKLRSSMNIEKAKLESMVNEEKQEVRVLRISVEESKNELQRLKVEWEKKEAELLKNVNEREEKITSMEKQIQKLLNLNKEKEEETSAMADREAQLKHKLEGVECELVSMRDTLEDMIGNKAKLMEKLAHKEDELNRITEQNGELHGREASALAKIDELSKLLKYGMVKQKVVENGVSDGKNDHDMVPAVVKSENGHDLVEEMTKVELPPLPPLLAARKSPKHEDAAQLPKTEVASGKPEDDPAESESKRWERFKAESNNLHGEDSELPPSSGEGKPAIVGGGWSFSRMGSVSSTENGEGGGSPTHEKQRKKKILFQKFGSLLRKKNSSHTK